MTRMAHRVIQEDDGWPSEEYPVRPTQSLTSNSEKASVVYGEDVDVTSGIGSSAQAWSPPQSYPSYEPNCTNIVRGGFGAAKENTRPGPSKASRQYPPPSNADYDLTSDGRHPKYRANFKPSLDEAAIVKESIKQQHAEEESHRTDTTTENSEGRKTGEDLAKDINFNRPTWITTTPGSSGVIYPANEQRQDFIDNINAGAELEYCMKCKKKHIPPGSPITLQDRDTCGAYLPDWFPAKSVDKPWDTFTSLLNEKLILDEILQGFTHKPNPDEPQWDLEFHDPEPKWRAIGRRGGWWKCRSTPDAPLAEQTCKLCHRVQSEEKGAAAKKGTGILARQKAIQDFMDKHIKEAALKDRAVVEERFRKEGILQHFGPDLPEETPDLRRDSSSSSVATDSTYAADSESSRKKDAKKNISKSSTSKSLKS